MEGDSQGFSIREYSRKRRSVELRECWPFSGEITVDLIHSLLPPITVVKFRWWSHELASLLTKPLKAAEDDSVPPITNRRSEGDDDDSYIFIDSKRKRTKDREVNRCREEAEENGNTGKKESCSGVSVSKKAGSVVKDHFSEFQIPGILKGKRKVCLVRSSDKSKVYEKRVKFSDGSGSVDSLELCCLKMNRLSLYSSEDQSSVDASDRNSVVQRNEFQPAVSERRARTELPCFFEGSDLERKGHSDQPIQSLSTTLGETAERVCSSFSQPASADLHLLCQSPLDPLLGEAILGFPLSLQGELVETDAQSCRSVDLMGLGTGSSYSASTGHGSLLGNVVDFSNGKKQLTEAALVEDGVERFPVHREKHHKYFPTRLGVDETFTEKAFFISDTYKDAECGQTVYSPVSEGNSRSSRINLSEHNGKNQNRSSRNVVADRNGLCLQNTRATMRLMGKDVSVGTSYSDMVRTGERIIAPEASVNCSWLDSHTRQSWLWQRPTTVGVLESQATIAVDSNWNRALLHDTSNHPFPLFCEPPVIPTSGLPPAILNPCCSLGSFPLPGMNLSFYGNGSGQANCFAFRQQQLPISPQFVGLPSDYSNVGIGLIPDARITSFGKSFSYTDSTRQSHPHWPQSFVESSCPGMSFVSLEEQLASFYGSKPA